MWNGATCLVTDGHCISAGQRGRNPPRLARREELQLRLTVSLHSPSLPLSEQQVESSL